MKRIVFLLGTVLVLAGCGGGGTGGMDEPMTDTSATAVDTNIPSPSPTVQTPRPQTPLGGEDATRPDEGQPLPSGTALAQQVETALRSSGAAQQITVSAQNGIVTLRGTVPSREEGDRLLEQARQVPGVQSVQNELTIQEGESQPPPQPRPSSQY